MIEEELFVVEKLQKALLGKPAIEPLNLVARVNAIKKGEDINNKYPISGAHTGPAWESKDILYNVIGC